MNTKAVLFVVALLSIPLVYSVSFASTSAELTRTSNVQVDTDDKGLISLTPNPDYGMVEVNETLSIDPQNVGANSMNPTSILTLGDTTNPSQDDAFTIQNKSMDQLNLSISLNAGSNYDSTSGSVTYYIYDSGTVNSISVGDTQNIQLNAGEEAYIAVQISSTATTGNLTTNLVITGGT